jgi:hypothetical protein
LEDVERYGLIGRVSQLLPSTKCSYNSSGSLFHDGQLDEERSSRRSYRTQMPFRDIPQTEDTPQTSPQFNGEQFNFLGRELILIGYRR